MDSFEEKLIEHLFDHKDDKYKEFTCKLIPTIDRDSVIGVRTPDMRKLAKSLVRAGGYEGFVNSLPHKYHEENFVHAAIIEQIKDFDTAVAETERFLPYINNWAVCDSFSPKCFAKNKVLLLERIRQWLNADDTYTVRFAIGMLMSHYLDGDFEPEYLLLVSGVMSDEYYIKMMQAWYFATALAKQYDSSVKFIEERRLSVWVHNKTIQKAVESYRITDEQKDYLKSLRIK